MDVPLPIFRSHYSIGKSMLSLAKPPKDDQVKTGSKSIVALAKKYDLDTVVLVDESMSGFLEAYENLKANGIRLVYGLRMTFCDDLNEKTSDTIAGEARYILLARNDDGYRRLLRIYSKAATDGRYYRPRYDFKHLNEEWSEDELTLCIPFYDSYVFNDTFKLEGSAPDFSKARPTFMVEDNDLPFDPLLQQQVLDAAGEKYEVMQAKTIYYELREDFRAYLAFRCISEKTTIHRPNLEHMSSNEFCLESWKEQHGSP